MKFAIGIAVALIAAVFAWALMAKKDKETTVAILAASAAISTAIIGNALTQQATAQREIAEGHRLHKTQVYTEFFDLVVKGFQAVKVPDDLPEDQKEEWHAEQLKEITQGYLDFSKKLLLWGSPEVVKAYENFRRYGQESQDLPNKQQTSAEIIYRVDDVFRSMRSDLGLNNRGLARGDLVKLFLTDPQTLDQLLRK